jgi:hypothetical protein
MLPLAAELLAKGGPAMPEEVGWQRQVAALAAERIRAVTAAGIIKRRGGPGDLTTAEIAYGDGRAEVEAIVAALRIALEQGKGADDLADLEARLARAVAAREVLARRAKELSETDSGSKSVLVDILAPEAAKGLAAAVGGLWRRRGEREKAVREAIADRLETARWPDFAAIGSEKGTDDEG